MILSTHVVNRLCFVTPAMCLVLLLATAPLAVAESPSFQPVKAELVRPRDGLGNVLAKLRGGQAVNIAYLGGSITAAAGWRVKTREWFSREFRGAEVHEINAAIGGTGSDLGVFRVRRDALQHNPDLLFVEFAVNDGGAAPQRIWQAMEGIVRQTWAANPRTDICFVYTYRVGYETDLQQGLCPNAASAMEMLADNYGIPSINVALKIVELQQAGKLVFQSDEPASPGVRAVLQGWSSPARRRASDLRRRRGRGRASNQRALASRSTINQSWQSRSSPTIGRRPRWFRSTPACFTASGRNCPPDAPLSKSFSTRMGTLWEATKPGSRLSFQFRGSAAKLYDLLGPDGGQVIMTVDGKQHTTPVPRFDSYCTYHRIATLPVAEGLDPNELHTVTIEVHPEQPDRQSVAFRLQDPDVELKSAKYQGTCVRVGQILVLGDNAEPVPESPEDAAARIERMEKIADDALVPPKLNTSPLPEYDYDKLDYGMTIGIERTPGGRLWACWVAGGDSPEGVLRAGHQRRRWRELVATATGGRCAFRQDLPRDRERAGRQSVDRSAGPTVADLRPVDGHVRRPGRRVGRRLRESRRRGARRGRRRVASGTASRSTSRPCFPPASGCCRSRSISAAALVRSRAALPNSIPCAAQMSSSRRTKGQHWQRRGVATFPNPDWHEHMIVERKDGTLWMLARTAKGIMQSTSTDGGKTWSEPVDSAIKHPNARFHVRRLASGRMLLVKHGRPIDSHEGRCKLTAWLSDDDGKTWQGGLVLDERKGISYPDGFQAPDGTIYISYDRNRATDGEILLARFTEDDILAGKLTGREVEAEDAHQSTTRTVTSLPVAALQGDTHRTKVQSSH